MRVSNLIFTMALVLVWGLHPTGSWAQDLQAQANELIVQAEALRTRGEVVIVGDEGVLIQGSNLSGSGIQRPEALLSRAAELYAELGFNRNNDPNANPTKEEGEPPKAIDCLKRALGIWQSLGDWKSPTGFLRRYAQAKKSDDDEFAICAEIKLAECYINQGDEISAAKIFANYATVEPKNEMLGRGKAYYAQYLLKQGKTEEALRMAQEVKDKCPSRDIYREQNDAQSIALAVLLSPQGAAKQGKAIASVKEGALLDKVEANPRKYFDLGNAAYESGDKARAITYWKEYRNRFPQEELSRTLMNRIAKIYVDSGNIPAAIDAYKETWTTYPDYREAWQARIEVSKLQEKSGVWKEALTTLDEGLAKTPSAQGLAWLTLRQAELYATNKMPDDAVGKYITLLSKYGDQDAARDASKQLNVLASKIKDWKKFTASIRDWLNGGKDKAGALGNSKLDMQARSELRRMGLAFYAKQDDPQLGISWLKSMGFNSSNIERDWIVRDEAWYYGKVCKTVLQKNPRFVSPKDLNDSVELGMQAWRIAPSTEEGLAGLKASYELVTTKNIKGTKTQNLIQQIEALKGSEYDSVATEMLIALYENTGDKKSADKLRN